MKKNGAFRKSMLTGALLSLLFSCSFAPVHAEGEKEQESTSSYVPLDEKPTNRTPIKEQLLDGIRGGLRLDFDALEIALPAKEEGKVDNVFDLSGSHGQFKVDGLSLHSLSFALNAPLSYNGVSRSLSLNLQNDALYVSLGDGDTAGVDYDVNYKASLSSFDDGEGIDSSTGGVSYFEYGQLDHFLSVILSTLGINAISLGKETDVSKTEIDWDSVLDSVNSIECLNGLDYRWDLPIGEDIFPIGIHADGHNNLSGISFPADSSSRFAVNNNVELRIVASISSEEGDLDWNLPLPEASYIEIEDSLDLYREIASMANTKSFGLEGSFTLTHSEAAVEGSDTQFEKEAVYEEATIGVAADCDFSSSLFGEVDARLNFASGSTSQDLRLRIEKEAEEAEDGSLVNAYLNLNDVLKVHTPVDVVSALLASLIDALSDPTIQNELIMKLIQSILSTIEAIANAIEVIKSSSIYRDIAESHYEDIVSTICELKAQDNKLIAKLDLSFASMDGYATIILDGRGGNIALASLSLDNVGITGSNSTETAFHLSGHLDLRPYEQPEFDHSGYITMTHLPHWTEEIDAIAERDQLQVQLDGYALKEGTVSKVSTKTANAYVYDPVAKVGRKEQGMAFHGSLAFDLKNKLGTGQMTFLDLKEEYVNDHSLKIDVTGEAGEDDSDENDMKGSGNHNAMYFEYNSKNTTVTKSGDSSTYNAENRSEPSNSPLKGSFSVHSLNGVIDVIRQLTDSTDPRFKRITNLISTITAETLLTKLLSGQYFELLATKLITSAEILDNSTTFEIAPGFLQPTTGLTIKIGYLNDGKPSTIEVWLTLEGETNTDVYAKITLGSTSFDSFPFVFASHSSGFVDYSSLKTLLQFALDTITLGATDLRSDTTYHIHGGVTLEIKLGDSWTVKDVHITLDIYLLMSGTNLKIIGRVFSPKTTALVGLVKVIPEDTMTNIFYETDGSDTSGTLYLTRLTGINPYSDRSKDTPTVDHKKVTGKDFGANMVDWLAKYILNLGSIVTDNLDGATSSAGQAFHGEDIVEGVSVTSSSLSAPKWKLDIGLGALAHTSLLGTLTADIEGKKVTYSDEANKAYAKNTLYRLTGGTTISIAVLNIVASLDFSIQNVSDGTYYDAWNKANGASIYRANSVQVEEKEWSWSKFKYITVTNTYHYYEDLVGSAEGLWNGAWGKTSANSAYTNAGWYTKP